MSKPSINLVTQAAFARRLGTSRQYVHQLVSIGLITLDKDGLIDSAKAVRAIEVAQDPARPRTRPQQQADAEDLAGASYHEARALKERYAALLRKLEYERLSGELIPAEEIVGAWQQLVAAFRAKCLALPSKLAPRLVGINESRTIQNILNVAVREALQELSQFRLPRRTRGNGSAKRVIDRSETKGTASVH